MWRLSTPGTVHVVFYKLYGCGVRQRAEGGPFQSSCSHVLCGERLLRVSVHVHFTNTDVFGEG
jgi:hypothetical protein